MMMLPKIGTLESIVLARLLQGDEICHLDFPEDSELSDPDVLERVVNNLNTSMYESEDDDKLIFDA